MNDFKINLVEKISRQSAYFHFHIVSGENSEQYVQYAIENEIEIWSFYTPRLGQILNSGNLRKSEDLSFVKMISIGGGKLSEVLYLKLKQDMKDRQNENFILKNGYGSVEIGCAPFVSKKNHKNVSIFQLSGNNT